MWLMLIVLAVTSSFLFAQHSTIVMQLWASAISTDTTGGSFYRNFDKTTDTPSITPDRDVATLPCSGAEHGIFADLAQQTERRDEKEHSVPPEKVSHHALTPSMENKETTVLNPGGDDSTADTPHSAATSWISAYRSGTLRIPAYQVPKCTDSSKQTAHTECPDSIDLRSPEYISSVMSRYNDELQEYYRQELKINPNLNGYVEVRFTIVPDGKVTQVTLLEWTIQSNKILQHVIDRVNSLEGIAPCDSTAGERTYRQRYTFGLSAK